MMNKTRECIKFNRDYRFQIGNPEKSELPSFDDSSWVPIALPHSFSIPYWRESTFYIGYGCYRKNFTIEPEFLNKKISIEFEGVFQHAEIFINGEFAGEHKGGYTGFSIDISKYIQLGDNILAVRVNNIWDSEIAPRSGEHVFCGGIYRNVSLIITDPLHVEWCGTFVTTPEVSNDFSKVNVKTEIRNDNKSINECTIQSSIISPKGDIVTVIRSTKTVDPENSIIFDQTSEKIENPELWDVDTPNLYSLKTSVFDGEQLVDEYYTSFGIRWFEFTADKGFFLNGKSLYLKGANVHQDHAGWGDALTDKAHFRDVSMIKECGMNFVRGSHYPHAPAFADACDKLGMVFWSESVLWGTGGFQQGTPWTEGAYPTEEKEQLGFEKSCHQTLKEMIRINRNHPSIVTWSMGNEAFFTEAEVMDRTREFTKEMVAASKKLDPSRPASMGGTQREEFDQTAEIAGYNGDGSFLYMNPGVPNLVAEYGSHVCDRPGIYDPCFGFLQEEQFEWRSGECIWCGFDHGSIGGDMGKMGMIDYFRLPKRTWYWYRNNLRGISPPVWPEIGKAHSLQISASQEKINSDGCDDVHLIVSVLDDQGVEIANEIAVELVVESGPGRFPTGRSITFVPHTDIPLIEGKAAIEFRSYHAGKSIIRATSEGVEDATVLIESLGTEKYDENNSTSVALYEIEYKKADLSLESSDIAIREVAALCPASASSQEDGFSPNFANNKDLNTSWKPLKDDLSPWWQIDLEGFYNIDRIVVDEKNSLLHKLLISNDGINWKEWEKDSISTRFLRIEFFEDKERVPTLVNIEVFV